MVQPVSIFKDVCRVICVCCLLAILTTSVSKQECHRRQSHHCHFITTLCFAADFYNSWF